MTLRNPGDDRLRAAFDAHADRLLRVLNQSGLGSGDAEDVVQDAFCVLARRLADVPEHNERAFLVGTALRMASALRRSSWHRSVQHAHDPDSHALASQSLEEDFDVCASGAAFHAALTSLPEEERLVFVLGHLEEMTRSEIASVLSLPAGTVATRLARGRTAFERGLRRLAPRRAASAPAHNPRPPQHFWDTRLVGMHRYENNTYRADRARGSFAQRLVTRRRAGRTELGWTWRWPGLDPEAFAFPEVVLGWKPWNGGPSTDPAFPLRIDQVRRLSLDYATETFALGSYNLAADLWLMDAAPASLAANPHAIASEVMIVVDQSRGTEPHGMLIGHTTLEGEPYELWLSPNFGASTRGGRGWPLLSFQSQHAAPRGTLNLRAFLEHLVDIGFARSDQYVASVELGNEIRGGAGTTWISRFEVETCYQGGF